MFIQAYTRTAGRQLTYEIHADERGSYVVLLGAKEMLRGRDRLSARGGQPLTNKRKAAGALHEAKLAIENLVEMDEI